MNSNEETKKIDINRAIFVSINRLNINMAINCSFLPLLLIGGLKRAAPYKYNNVFTSITVNKRAQSSPKAERQHGFDRGHPFIRELILRQFDVVKNRMGQIAS